MVGRLAIKTLCDSWLEHIYQKKIKFRFDLSQADDMRPDNHNHSAASPEPNSSWQTSVFCASGWSPVNISLKTPGGERGGGEGDGGFDVNCCCWQVSPSPGQHQAV